MKIVRAILGALVGYLIFAITAVLLGLVSGRNLHADQPFWFMAVTAIYGMAFAGVGGIVASRIAPHRDWAMVGMTGVLALGAGVSLVMSPAADARWSQWAALLLMAPCAIIAPHLLGRAPTRVETL
jgi:uncharacterized membrane protein YhaH (DUF805 family)